MSLNAALRELEAAMHAMDVSGRAADLEPVLKAAAKAVREYQDLREGQTQNGGDLWRFARGNFQFHRPGEGRACWRRREANGWEIHITDPSERRAELAPGEQWKVRWVRPDRTDIIFRSASAKDVEAAIKIADDFANGPTKLFAAAGFQFHTTGGSLTAWLRREGEWQILITDPTGSSHDLDEGETYLISIHHPEREKQWMQTCPSADPRQAVFMAGGLLAEAIKESGLPRLRKEAQ